jgi:hypothetical protein
MAIDQRVGTKVIKNLRREEATATRVDPHPYIGVVKNNLDPTRSGRLQVYIPDLGGNPEDQKNWRTVSYASPFMGYTTSEPSTLDKPNFNNKFDSVTHTYGMWMVPPDIGVNIIVLFIAGDPLRGYWLACVNNNLSHHMLPAMAGSTNVELGTATANTKKSYIGGNPMPVVEFNENVKDAVTRPEFYNNPKPIHEIQYQILKVQGLDRDPIRGAISSSSQRETPSHVFGISTPGRPINDPADDATGYIEKLNADALSKEYFKVKTRKGGHVFVMDDGATLGQDQLIRLRSAKGHQVLLHDTENSLYLGHADGDSWIELTKQGQVNIYTNGGFNVRSEGDINLHSDASIRMQAANNIHMSAGSAFQIDSSKINLLSGSIALESSGAMSVKTGGAYSIDVNAKISVKAGGALALQGSTILQNSGGTDAVKNLDPIPTNGLNDTQFDTGTDRYNIRPKALSSIVTVAPTHEPYDRGTAPVFFASAAVKPQDYTGTADQTKNVSGTSVSNPASDKDLRNQPPCDCSIGNLTPEQLTAFYAQIGKSESGGNYSAVNSIGYIGKYQFGYPALIDAGLVKRSCKSNAQLRNPNSWVGGGGPASLEEFLASRDVQERIMCDNTKRNYNTMCKIGAITTEMPSEDVAGMLAVSHLLGAGGANSWRKGAGGADANGTTGDTYFQKGKYSVAVLAPKMPAINAG